MTTTITHNDLTFTITVVSFPNAHVAIVRSADPTIGFRREMRDMPSVRLATETAIAFIERTF